MDAVLSNLDSYWLGLRMTLQLLLVGALGASVIGVVIAFLRISPIPSLRWIATAYTELVRNTPLTLVFFFIIVVLPSLDMGVHSVLGAYIALSLYHSAFVAEALRSGINGVPLGQAEAARSVGLNFMQTVTLVVFPQAMRMVVPPLINVFIALTKNTSVAGGFLVVELFAISKTLTNAHGNAVIAILLGVAFCYLIITIPLGQVAGRIEKKVAVLR